MDGPKFLELDFLSDTTLGKGEGTAGEVDVEVDHDELGLPVARGKLIRGLLRDEWLAMRGVFGELEKAEKRIFGQEGELLGERSILRIGDGVVAEEERVWFEHAVRRPNSRVRVRDILRSLTDIRRQTAMSRETGAPEKETLRATRVVIRGIRLRAALGWMKDPDGQDLRCLALCVLAVRHAGLGRHRGRGHVRLSLEGNLSRTRELAGLGR